MPSKRLLSTCNSLFAAALVLAVPAFLSGASAQGQSSSAPLSLKVGTQASAASQAHGASIASGEEENTPLKNDASHQGIKVHGHWKIVVKNADGSIAETREFENSLTAIGANTLAGLLVGGVAGGYTESAGMGIDLTTSGTSICGKTNCLMVPSTTVGTGGFICGNAAYSCSTSASTATIGGANNGVITLAGQFTATQSGTITTVSSILGGCPYTVSQFNCAQSSGQGGINGSFTSTNITAIAVNGGQLVQATVTISFS